MTPPDKDFTLLGPEALDLKLFVQALRDIADSVERSDAKVVNIYQTVGMREVADPSMVPPTRYERDGSFSMSFDLTGYFLKEP